MTEMQRALQERLPKLWAPACSLLHFLLDFYFLNSIRDTEYYPMKTFVGQKNYFSFNSLLSKTILTKTKQRSKLKKKKHPKKPK